MIFRVLKSRRKLASQSRFFLSVLGCIPILLEEYFVPLLIITLRFWMAKVIFCVGLSKLSGLLGLFLLFVYEYSMPLLGSVLFAILFTASNYLISALLIGLGFLSRIASFQMLIVTTVVYLSYDYFIEYYPFLVIGSTLALFCSGFFNINSSYEEEELATLPL